MPTLVLQPVGQSKPQFRFPFPSPANATPWLEVKWDHWEAWLEGDFDPHADYELSAGQEPDIRFDSLVHGSECLLFHRGPRDDLFAQTFKNSILFLRCWPQGKTDYPQNSQVLLEIGVFKKVSPEKEKRCESLMRFFYENAGGYFLIDAVHGQTLEKVSQDYRPGFSSYNDPESELSVIENILTEDFRRALLDILRNPNEHFASVPCLQRVAGIRRLPATAFRRILFSPEDDARVWADKRIPSLETPCNNAISTFLDTLLRRLGGIHQHFEGQISHSSRELGKALHRKKPAVWMIAQTAGEKDAISHLLARCNDAREFIRPFLGTKAFAFSPKRSISVFRIPSAALSISPAYRFVLEKIRGYSRTNCYWIGDPHPFFRLPARNGAAGGCDAWIRKYSMMYEFWCYLEMHRTLEKLGFVTKDIPRKGHMQVSAFENETRSLNVFLYHDVCHTGKKVPVGLDTGGKTPDFAIVFEHRVTKKLALLVLDAKSDSNFAPHIPEKRNDYLVACSVAAERAKDLVFTQAWILLSGDECDSFAHGIECPPLKDHQTPFGQTLDEFSLSSPDGGLRKALEACAQELTWMDNAKRFHYAPAANSMQRYSGYVFTHIRRQDDPVETNRFRLFLEAQVELMEKVLAKW